MITLSSQLIVTLITLAALVGLVIGWIFGHLRGKDAGWLERHFEQQETERKRRNKDGTFRSLRLPFTTSDGTSISERTARRAAK